MDASPLLWIAVALGLGGVLVLRLSWARRARSWPLNSAGWALIVVASVTSVRAEGAWGLSVTILVAMAAAGGALALAAARSPRAKATASSRRVRMLPEAGEPRRILARLLTFVIVVFGGFAVSLGLALASRWLGMGLGWGAANANALAFLALPLVWGILASVLLMQKRRGQVATLIVASLPAWPVVITGLSG